MKKSGQLTLYEAARKALLEAVKVDEVKQILDRAAGLAEYARRAKDPELIGNATKLQLIAVERLGEVMDEERKAGRRAKGGGERRVPKKPVAPTLASQNVDKNLADRARKAVAMGKEKYANLVDKKVRIAVAAAENDKAVIAAACAERHAAKKQKREAREAALANKLLALPQKKYAVIVADPEWQFEFWPEKGLTNSSADNHYRTSALDKIKARDVPSIAADDCVLFLWATVPMLPHALEVMAAWGFAYKSLLVWVKNKAGTGYWFRNKNELLLVGTKGNIPAPADGTQSDSVLIADVGKHSAKPEQALEIIERYYPNVPKIELNRRGAPRPGWDAWGDEVEANNEAA
jgi:N6-adenosine-specific RNA methylase IME4